ncbi:MAG TPA: PEP/pyruvate-binding domain-containing protein [Synergistales bacterium]|nr:PEP/pyruvate-binding domain-containing protein [Synergistales bacterium]
MAASFIEIFAENALHWAGSEKARHGGKPIFSFSSFPQRHPFFFNLQKELSTYLEDAMGIPVDFEFTYDTSEEKLCLLQLRPLAAFEEMAQVNLPEVKESSLILKGNRMVSNGVLENVSHLVYIDPSVYGKDSKYYEIAREVGRVNDSLEGSKYILVGPGRWGSTNPLLGVPVKYNEICHCGCLVEVGISESDFVPELSYGTHFFLDLDVDGILYLPVFDGEKGDVFNREWLDNTPYEECRHPAVRIYQGNFSVFLDGEKEIGIVFTS